MLFSLALLAAPWLGHSTLRALAWSAGRLDAFARGYDQIKRHWQDQEQLARERDHWRETAYQAAWQLEQLSTLKAENDNLKALLSAAGAVEQADVTLVRVLEKVPHQSRWIINVGSHEHVHQGQALLDRHGVVGQVVHAFSHQAVVMLLTDPDSRMPVATLDDQWQGVAEGSASGELSVRQWPDTVPVKPGQRLKTSGLGGTFLPGLPVARVLAAEHSGKPFAEVKLKPEANLQAGHYLLLVWKHPHANTSQLPNEPAAR